MGLTPAYLLPYPELTDSANVPRDTRALAEAVEGALTTHATPHTAKYKNAVHNLTISTWATVTYEADEYAAVGISYSAGVFTMSEAGIYQFNALALFQNPAWPAGSPTCRLGLVVDGAARQESAPVANSGTSANLAVYVSKAIRCNAGSTAYFRAQANVSGTYLAGSGVRYTNADITRIAP